MSQIEAKTPGPLKRTRRAIVPTELPKFDKSDDRSPTTQLEAIEQSARVDGQNVAADLHAAQQRGFALGLQEGMQEGRNSSAAFFRDCIEAAGAALL